MHTYNVLYTNTEDVARYALIERVVKLTSQFELRVLLNTVRIWGALICDREWENRFEAITASYMCEMLGDDTVACGSVCCFFANNFWYGRSVCDCCVARLLCVCV